MGKLCGWDVCGGGQFVRAQLLIVSPQLQQSGAYYLVYSKTTFISKLGISLVYKRPRKKTPSMFTFLYPLSSTIWICIVAAYFLASFVLCFLSILPQAQQKILQKKSKHLQAECEREINFLNSFWFTLASILQQGTDFMPRYYLVY